MIAIEAFKEELDILTYRGFLRANSYKHMRRGMIKKRYGRRAIPLASAVALLLSSVLRLACHPRDSRKASSPAYSSECPRYPRHGFRRTKGRKNVAWRQKDGQKYATLHNRC